MERLSANGASFVCRTFELINTLGTNRDVSARNATIFADIRQADEARLLRIVGGLSGRKILFGRIRASFAVDDVEGAAGTCAVGIDRTVGPLDLDPALGIEGDGFAFVALVLFAPLPVRSAGDDHSCFEVVLVDFVAGLGLDS